MRVVYRRVFRDEIVESVFAPESSQRFLSPHELNSVVKIFSAFTVSLVILHRHEQPLFILAHFLYLSCFKQAHIGFVVPH